MEQNPGAVASTDQLGPNHQEQEMQRVDVWVAHGDGGDRGIGPAIAYCSTESQARQAAAKQGWYGGDGAVVKRYGLKMYGKVWLLAERDPIDMDSAQAKRDADLRDATLAALNAEQRRVLGLGA